MSLSKIQSDLKAPKGQFNSFGKYRYRSCEDILEAVKPLLAMHGYSLTLTDDIIEVGGRVYVQATAEIFDGSQVIARTTASAREPEAKKGMDESQITGAASSYARKYALSGLLALDDTKDADATNNHAPQPEKTIDSKQAATITALVGDNVGRLQAMLSFYKIESVDQLPASKYEAVVTRLKGGEK